MASSIIFSAMLLLLLVVLVLVLLRRIGNGLRLTVTTKQPRTQSTQFQRRKARASSSS
jgi:hypothetical protein